MNQLDPFLTTYLLERQKELHDGLVKEYGDYKTDTAKNTQLLVDRIKELEDSNSEFEGTIHSLTDMITSMGKIIESMNGELVDTKLTNIKQEMVVRTLMNLNQYQAHDMFVDTFTTADGIDWSGSTRGEWFSDLKAVGRTTASTVYVSQLQASSKLLITGNAGDDNAVCQSFVLDRTQDIDKISLFLEKHHESVWKPLFVRVTDDLAGTNVITTGVITPAEIYGEGWYDIELSNIELQKNTDYFITVYTEDTYGYRIGWHTTTDTYFSGTSYTKFNNVWTDNNFDIAFKVWCYAAKDEDNATIITVAHSYKGKLETIVFDVESVTYTGSINYYVSVNDGADWKILEPGMETSLLDIPAGNKLRIKAYIDGNSRIDAWGFVIKRGETK